MGEGPAPLRSAAYSYPLVSDTTDEAEEFIGKVTLSGGDIAMPFEVGPWGHHDGRVEDRFGIRWDVNVPGAGTLISR